MPDNPQDVIMGGACCEICYNIDIGHYEPQDQTWYLKGGDELKWGITHWMPLPEPPQITENQSTTE